MSNFLEFIEKHKLGLLVAFGSYMVLFVYVQMETYEREFSIDVWGEKKELVVDEKQEIEIQPENIEQNPNQFQNQGEVKSISRDMNDKREKSEKNWDENKISKQIEDKIRNQEQQFKKEAGGDEKRSKIIQELENSKQNSKNNSSVKNKSTTTSSGGNTAYSGTVMVDWELAKREPHQGNNWYVRNPGYTCGDKSNGLVHIKIKVDQSGKVISAIYSPENSSNASSCMIEQAKKYAMMSRFSYSASSSSSQEGKIVYTFVGQ
ncbi:MAG: hypothetical protein V4622_13875 [Bacteroidota bacterium]